MGKTNITKAAVALTAGLAAFGVTGFAVAQGGQHTRAVHPHR